MHHIIILNSGALIYKWHTLQYVNFFVPSDLPGSKTQSKIPTSAISATSLSGSETDVSTSTENLSQEERYVIRHTARQEPQGQEKQEVSLYFEKFVIMRFLIFVHYF